MIHRASAAAAHSLRGHVLPMRVHLISRDASAALRAPARNGSVSFAARPGRRPAGGSYRERSGLFPNVDSTPQYTPHTDLEIRKTALREVIVNGVNSGSISVVPPVGSEGK